MDNKEQLEPEDAFFDRINTVLQRRKELGFDESVREYRQIEADFVERADDNEAQIVEIKRRVTEQILMNADRTGQPHKVCREIWEELVQRGFGDINMRHVLSRIYARCCQFNGEFDAGLAVLESLIAELEALRAQPALSPDDHSFCNQFLAMHTEMRDKLKAGIRE